MRTVLEDTRWIGPKCLAILAGLALALVLAEPEPCGACAVSYAPTEQFDLVIDSVFVDGEAVEPGPEYAGLPQVVARPDSAFYLINRSAGHSAVYARRR